MTIDKSGEYWVGTMAADLDEYLRLLTAESYPADRIVHATCTCGNDRFRLQADSNEGCARRVCTRCRRTHLICDSEESWSDAEPEALWNDSGVVDASPGEWLAMPDIASLLRLGPAHFVIADPGLPLQWIDLASCYRFWKDDAKLHVVPPHAAVRLEDMPGGYFYRAQKWLPADPTRLASFRDHAARRSPGSR